MYQKQHTSRLWNKLGQPACQLLEIKYKKKQWVDLLSTRKLLYKQKKEVQTQPIAKLSTQCTDTTKSQSEPGNIPDEFPKHHVSDLVVKSDIPQLGGFAPFSHTVPLSSTFIRPMKQFLSWHFHYHSVKTGSVFVPNKTKKPKKKPPHQQKKSQMHSIPNLPPCHHTQQTALQISNLRLKKTAFHYITFLFFVFKPSPCFRVSVSSSEISAY